VIAKQSNHLTWIWNQLRDLPIERLAISMLAQNSENDYSSLGSIRTGLEALGYQVEQEKLIKALHNLVEEEFVEEEPIGAGAEGMQYRIPIGLTRAWLRAFKPLEMLEYEVKCDEE
jgi:hypothetical protein